MIRQQDGPRTLFYLDPPYPHATRATTGQYAHEMSEADHAELLSAVRQVRGKVMLSGDACPLDDEALAGWKRHVFDVVKHSF